MPQIQCWKNCAGDVSLGHHFVTDGNYFRVAAVGASFAGLACARACAMRGIRTVVVERKSDVGDMPHTTGILVKEVADEWDVPEHLTRKIHGVRLYAPSLRSVDIVSAGYYFLATDTPRMMRWLASEAEEAGAQILTDTDYRGARWDRGRFWLEGTDLSCQLLVGADGAQSRIAR